VGSPKRRYVESRPRVVTACPALLLLILLLLLHPTKKSHSLPPKSMSACMKAHPSPGWVRFHQGRHLSVTCLSGALARPVQTSTTPRPALAPSSASVNCTERWGRMEIESSCALAHASPPPPPHMVHGSSSPSLANASGSPRTSSLAMS
jgi:hypothetical protein